MALTYQFLLSKLNKRAEHAVNKMCHYLSLPILFYYLKDIGLWIESFRFLIAYQVVFILDVLYTWSWYFGLHRFNCLRLNPVNPEYLKQTLPSLHLDMSIATKRVSYKSRRKWQTAYILMRWHIISHLIRIYNVCKSISLSLQGWKGCLLINSGWN